MPNVRFNERMQSMNFAYPYCLAAIQKFCDTGEGLKELAGHKGVFRLRANDGNHTRLILLPKEENGERVWVWHMTLPNHKYEKLEQKPASWWRNLQTAPLSAFATFTDYRSSQEGLHIAEPVSSTPIPQVAESSTPQQFDFNTASPSLVLYNDEWISLSQAQIELCENMKFPAVVSGVPGAGKSCIAFASLVRQVERLPAELSEKRFLYVTQSAELVHEMQRNWDELLALGLLRLPPGCTVEFKTTQEVATEHADKGLAFFVQPEASIKASVLSQLEKALETYHQNPNNRKKENELKQPPEELYQEIRAMSGYDRLNDYEKAIGEKHKKHTLVPNEKHRAWLWEQKPTLLASLPTLQNFTPPYDFIAVDETQDLWRLEIKLLSNLAKREQTLYSVGDHQSLYDSQFIVPYIKSLHWQHQDFDNEHSKKLLEVYRCPQGVCDGANVVLELENKITGYTRYQVQKIHPSKETKAAPGETFWLGGDKQLQEQLKKIHGLFAVVMPQAFNEEKQAALQKSFKDKGKNVLTLEQFRVLQAEPDSEEKTKKINEIDGLAFTPAEIKGLGFKNVFIYEPLSHDPRFIQANTVLRSQDPDKKAQVNPVELKSINPLALRPAFDELFTSISRSSGNVFIVQPEDQKVRLLSQQLKAGIDEAKKNKYTHTAQANLLQVTQEEKSEKLAKIQEALRKEAEAKAKQLEKEAEAKLQEEQRMKEAVAKKAAAEKARAIEASRAPKQQVKKPKKAESKATSSAPIASSSSVLRANPASSGITTAGRFDLNQQLYNAAEKGRRDVVLNLLAKGVDANAAVRDFMGIYTPALYTAAENGHRDIIHDLVAQGANVNATVGHGGATALYTAAQNGRLGVVQELLLAKDIQVDAAFNDGTTPLMVAAFYGSLKMVECLINKGADVFKQDFNKRTAADIAAKRSPAVEQYLRSVMAEKSAELLEQLYFATQEGRADIVCDLLAKGIDANTVGPDGSTLLFIAAQEGHLDVVKILFTKGANVKAANFEGKTPLQVATENEYFEVAKFLSENSVNSVATNPHGFHASLPAPVLAASPSAVAMPPDAKP